jgi:hypothetical protein
MTDISPYSQPKPPKTITKVSDDRFLDFTCLHTWILLSAIGSALYLFNCIARSTGALQIAYVALLLVIIAIWIKYFSTFEKVDRRKLRVKFFYAGIQGKHVINTYTEPVTNLEKIIPILKIHEDGIIEFRGGIFGALIKLNPVRISEEEREIHEKRIEKIINGLPVNTHFKTLSCSRLEPRKPILRYILELIGKSKGEKATDIHLSTLYTKISEDNSPVISWQYYAFLSLGEHKTISEARIQYGAIVPGLLKNMGAARLSPMVYTDRNDIIRAYRTMFMELVI